MSEVVRFVPPIEAVARGDLVGASLWSKDVDVLIYAVEAEDFPSRAWISVLGQFRWAFLSHLRPATSTEQQESLEVRFR